MKLFYMPHACSLAPHILLRELQIPFDLEKVSHTEKSNLLKYNSKGHVPTLVLDSGEVLSEGAVILQYLADLKPDSGFAPKAGTMARYRVQEWLNYLASEIHKPFGVLFGMKTQLGEKELDLFRQKLGKEIKWMNDQLAGGKYLTGEQITIADLYAFVMLGWSKVVNLDLSGNGNILGYLERIQNRPAVRTAVEAEAGK